jgi:hypothetical protein
MIARAAAFVMTCVIAAAAAPQAPPSSFFLGTWRNTSEGPPGGPSWFRVEFRDGKTLVTIEGMPEQEPTLYRLMSTGSGPRQEKEAAALMVNTDRYLFIVRRAEGGKAILEMYPKQSGGRGGSGMLGYTAEPFAKDK